MYTILLVEDEAMELLALKYAIHISYPDLFDILEATDGNTALSLCQKFDPSIMIVDINIPGMSGLDLIQAVNNLNINVKLLITTAYDKSDYVRRALDMGVISYLLKPVNVTELKTAVDRCLQQIEQSNQEKRQLEGLLQGIASARSYANEYLVQDILSGHAPAEVLQNVCGWPEDGQLQACILWWLPAETSDCDLFYETCYHFFYNYFYLLFSPYQNGGLLFLQALQPMDENSLLLLLRIALPSICKKIGEGRFAGTKFYKTYEDLLHGWTNLQQNVHSQTTAVSIPPLPMNILGSQHSRILLRQKIIQRIRDRQIHSLANIMKKFYTSDEKFWPGIALFLEAFYRYDPTIDLLELFPLFLRQNRCIQDVLKYLEQYYKKCGDRFAFTATETYVETAQNFIRQNFQKDLSLTEVAEELGLSAPYFSNLFKQQTGKTFIAFLNEVRIQHSIALMEQGETNMEYIAHQCGYYNKKYFLETFKRITGQSVTQYRQGDH